MPSQAFIQHVTSLRLLIQEALGYHAHIHPVLGANGASVIYALAGCLDFDALQDKQCGVNETEIHVPRFRIQPLGSNRRCEKRHPKQSTVL